MIRSNPEAFIRKSFASGFAAVIDIQDHDDDASHGIQNPVRPLSRATDGILAVRHAVKLPGSRTRRVRGERPYLVDDLPPELRLKRLQDRQRLRRIGEPMESAWHCQASRPSSSACSSSPVTSAIRPLSISSSLSRAIMASKASSPQSVR